MKHLMNLLKKVLSMKIAGCEAAVLEKEFSVPTLRRSRDGYNANHLSSLIRF